MKRLVSRAALLLAVSATAHSSFAATYYFDSSASGAGAGSASSPWSNLSAANALDLNPGDKLYLRGTFNAPEGGIRLDARDSGSASNPVAITSWGDSRATINAGTSYGIKASNVGGISISNLNINGAGASQKQSNGLWTSEADGIRFYTHETKQNFIRVDNVTVKGFGENGINLRGGNGSAGFNDIKITNSVFAQNQRAGVNIYADHDNANRSAHSNLVIDNVKAYDNPGRATSKNEGHSGNGIVIGQVNGGVIQNSVAYNNGSADASHEGGSVGIWAWDSNKITIQHNESYNNGTAGQHDGGGFDLDGGVSNSVIQYNYSHGNAGAGYLLAQYKEAGNDFTGNVIANNISKDDGRKNGYGGIHAFGDIDNSKVEGNIVYITPAEKGIAGTRGEAPAAIKLRGSGEKDIDFTDNVLIVLNDGDNGALQPTMFANTSNAKGFTLEDNEQITLKGDTDGDALKIESLLAQWGEAMSEGKVLSLDSAAFEKFLAVNEVKETPTPTNPLPDVKDEVVKEVIKQVTKPTTPTGPVVVTAPAAEVETPTAVVPEPSGVAILAIAGSALLKRRRRATA